MSIIEKAVSRLENKVSKRLDEVARRRDLTSTQPGLAGGADSQVERKAYYSDSTKKIMAEYADPAVYEQIREQGFMTPKDKLQLTMDEYRTIKRPLLENIFGKRNVIIENGRLILVTSAIAGEGKTYTSINLALSMVREQGLSVLLVDSDIERRNASRVFGADEAPGLLDYLGDESLDVRDMIIDIDVPNLTLLPAGYRDRFSTELMASERMHQLLAMWMQDNPQLIVIFDGPPVLQTSDPQVLATHVGQIIMVVEAVKTPKNVVNQALSMLDKNKAINLVLNRTHRSLGLNYYGDYYGKRD